MAPGAYLVVAKDPNFLAAMYTEPDHRTNLVGPYDGGLERSQRANPPVVSAHADESQDRQARELSWSRPTRSPTTTAAAGPKWADGMRRQPRTARPAQRQRRARRLGRQRRERQDPVEAVLLHHRRQRQPVHPRHPFGSSTSCSLNAGEVLIDDLELVIDGVNRLTNGGFESGESSWRILGNHTRSFVTDGGPSLRLAGAAPDRHRPRRPRGQSHQPIDHRHQRGTVTFRGWARWLRGQPLPAAADDAGEVARHAAATGACLRAGHAARSGHAGPAEYRLRRQSRPGHSRRAARAHPARRRASRSS